MCLKLSVSFPPSFLLPRRCGLLNTLCTRHIFGAGDRRALAFFPLPALLCGCSAVARQCPRIAAPWRRPFAPEPAAKSPFLRGLVRGTQRCDPRPAAPSPLGGCLAPFRSAPVGFGPPALLEISSLPPGYPGRDGGVRIVVYPEGTPGSRGPDFGILSERQRERARRCTPDSTGRASAPWCAA